MQVNLPIEGYTEIMNWSEECTYDILRLKKLIQLQGVFIIVLISISGAFTVSFGQVKEFGIPGIQNYSKSNYHAGTQNWSIAQDTNEFIYFANNDGVLRFDGIHWDLIEVSQSAAVRSIFIDDINKIYVGLYNDFGTIVKNENGQYVYSSLRNLIPSGIANFDEIWKIHSSSDGIIFQSFDYIFILNDNHIKVVEPEQPIHFSFEVGDQIYVNNPDEGLYELRDGYLEKISWSDGLRGMEVWGMTVINDSNLLIGTSTNGIFLMEEGVLKKWDTPVGKLIEKYQLYSLTTLQDDYLAFGTILNGLIISDSNGEIVQQINISNGLQNNTVLSIFSDTNQNLWLGLDNGIDYLRINSPITYFTEFGKIGTGYACIIHDGRLYFGTNQGLYVKSLEPVSSVEEEFQLVENTAGQVWSLSVHNGQLICGHNSGTLIIEGAHSSRIVMDQGSWRYTPLKQQPDFLLGGSYNGLFILENTLEGWKYRNRIKGFNESSRYLGQDSEGTIWVSHGSKGVYRLELNTALDSVVTKKLYTAENGLPSSEQNILFQFSQKLYLSTIEGIYKYNGREDKFIPADDLDQLPMVGQLKTIETDGSGGHWFITDKESGVFRFNEDITYTKITLPFRQLNDQYVNGFEFIYPHSNEHIFFGIDNGFAHYTSKKSKIYNSPLKAFITKVELPYLDSTIHILDADLLDNLKFPFSKNAIRIHYTAPFYEHQNRVEFSFILEDFQNDWSSWSDISYKDFTNLAPGNYKFGVKARNIFEVESTIAGFEFTILPPWYKTFWARIMYTFLFFILLFLLLKYIQIRIENTKIKVIHNHRTELKLKEEKYHLQKLLTEKEIIRLKNEKLEGEMLFRNKELANQTMGIIQKNEFLLEVKEELQRISKIAAEEKIRKRLAGLTRNINKEIDNKQQQQLFETYFEEVHFDFFQRLKNRFPQLTPREMRLCAYIKMNLTSKEIAALLNISDRGVEISRYRLRKKMELARDTNLSTFLTNI